MYDKDKQNDLHLQKKMVSLEKKSQNIISLMERLGQKKNFKVSNYAFLNEVKKQKTFLDDDFTEDEENYLIKNQIEPNIHYRVTSLDEVRGPNQSPKP